MKSEKIKTALSLAIILALVISNVITLKLFIDSKSENETELVKNTGDELSRVKFFIKDWFDELSEKNTTVSVFRNELRFGNNDYTLTVAGDRIRAVYPKGTRYFQLEYIKYIEFFEENANIKCKLYFNETGELIFNIE